MTVAEPPTLDPGRNCRAGVAQFMSQQNPER